MPVLALNLSNTVASVLDEAANGQLTRIGSLDEMHQCEEKGYPLVVTEWHTTNIPIIAHYGSGGSARSFLLWVACRGTDKEGVAALHLGADDVIGFPASAEFVYAKLRALFRNVPEDRTALTVDAFDIAVDVIGRRVTTGGNELHLTRKQFDVFALLVERKGGCVSRDEIRKRLWGFDSGTNTVDVVVCDIRKKLRSRGITDVIATVSGSGYRVG